MKPTTFKLDQPWQVVKEKLMENNVELTEEDLAYERGQEDQLLERLQKKMGLDKERIKELIESISSNRGKAS